MHAKPLGVPRRGHQHRVMARELDLTEIQRKAETE
jgi:hypothetical protein